MINAAVSRADLRVAASASEAELSPGEAFELAATAGNVGDRRASATTLRYYRSADAMIATGDTEVGTDPLAGLAAAQSIARSLSLSAPTAPGTYHYGACVDAVAEETNTANNCSAAVAVTVREPPRRPDLEVTASASDAALEPGESFGLRATVRNRGDADDAALPPVFGRDDRDNGRAGGNGRGGSAGRLGFERGIDRADGADDLGHVLLRGVR